MVENRVRSRRPGVWGTAHRVVGPDPPEDAPGPFPSPPRPLPRGVRRGAPPDGASPPQGVPDARGRAFSPPVTVRARTAPPRRPTTREAPCGSPVRGRRTALGPVLTGSVPAPTACGGDADPGAEAAPEVDTTGFTYGEVPTENERGPSIDESLMPPEPAPGRAPARTARPPCPGGGHREDVDGGPLLGLRVGAAVHRGPGTRRTRTAARGRALPCLLTAGAGVSGVFGASGVPHFTEVSPHAFFQ